MSRGWLLLAVALVASAVSLLAAAAAPAATLDLYVGCSTASTAPPSHSCELGETPGAFLESDKEVEFEVCVSFPGSHEMCAESQPAAPGILYVNTITTNHVGEHVVRWYVGGREVASWAFTVEEPLPAVPPPGGEAQPPTPPEVEPAITPVCRRARARAELVRKRLRHADGRRRRAALRMKLRRDRAGAKRICS